MSNELRTGNGNCGLRVQLSVKAGDKDKGAVS